ncbi:act minimal PKS acyl carrier protein [Tamaricihabitans halophyticus]|uniref:Act minimal PKS acyl carrier protein n=1 Tax=Tamaricihabitans halophyticus TaxID=1262583 RepID=A0A4R2R2L2_9PSEU|nr:acyl carrier protein [Tamaricihabitans halophyticus]TCP56793.1 act minimal PKS acyl carrier protein [Tamaricihabitans halophyticus]
MPKFTLDDLRRTLRESTGIDEEVDLDGDIADTEFVELGYDSLALLQVASEVERSYGVPIPGEQLAQLTTPGSVVTFINEQLQRAGV